MADNDNQEKLSVELAYIIAFFQDVTATYESCVETQSLCDKKTTDFNHVLELEDLSDSELMQIAIDQRENLRERRRCKDIQLTYKPLIDQLDTKESARFINLLKNTLGQVRKMEKTLETRTYHKRVKDP